MDAQEQNVRWRSAVTKKRKGYTIGLHQNRAVCRLWGHRLPLIKSVVLIPETSHLGLMCNNGLVYKVFSVAERNNPAKL